MKRLIVQYTDDELGQDIVLFDGPVAEMTWKTTTSGVVVEGKTKPTTSGAGLLSLLGGLPRQQNTDKEEVAAS